MRSLKKLLQDRAVERTVFVVIIGFLLLVSFRSQQEYASVTGKATVLEEQSELRMQKLEALQEEYFKKQRELVQAEQDKEVIVIVQEASVPDTTPLQATWDVDGEILYAIDYHGVEIQEHKDEIASLEEKLDDDNEDEIEQKIREHEREIRELLDNDPKYFLYNVSFTVNNSRNNSANVTYIVCWIHLDCLTVKAEDTVTVEPGENTITAELGIPTKVLFDRKRHTLWVSLAEGESVLVGENYVIELPALQ